MDEKKELVVIGKWRKERRKKSGRLKKRKKGNLCENHEDGW